MIKRETQKHLEAFEIYYGMNNRTLQKLAAELNVTLKSVHLWSKSFDWEERIAQRDVEVKKKMDRKAISNMSTSIINEKANYRKVIKLTVGKILDDIKNNKMAYKVSDLDRLIRLDMFLLGENDSSLKIDGNISLTDEDRQLISSVGNSMKYVAESLGED